MQKQSDSMMDSSVLKKEYRIWKHKIFRWMDSNWKQQQVELMNSRKEIGCVLPPTTDLRHYGVGCVINENVTLGKHVQIWQNVTIGERNGGVPTIEDYVKIFANAVIIGGITVGHHSVIAAGAVVYRDVLPYSLVKGNCEIDEGKYDEI